MPLLTHLVQRVARLGRQRCAAAAVVGAQQQVRSSARRRARPDQRGCAALVLYPMNALVEDQMVRLRRILDGDGQLEWLRRERRGHRFYFGRYTGQTPHRDLQRVHDARSRAGREEAERLGPDYRPYVARPLGAELLTREDMQLYPPDILITNFSMLNVMLNRRDEAAIFEQTADVPRERRGRASTSSSTSCTPTRARPAPRSRCCSAASCTGSSSTSTRRSCASSRRRPRSATPRRRRAPTSRSSSASTAPRFAVLAGIPRDLGPPPSRPPAARRRSMRSAHRRRQILDGEASEADAVAAAVGDTAAFAREHQLAVRLVDVGTRRGTSAGREARRASSPLALSRSRRRSVRDAHWPGRSCRCSAAVPRATNGEEDFAFRCGRTCSSALFPAGGRARAPTVRLCPSSSDRRLAPSASCTRSRRSAATAAPAASTSGRAQTCGDHCRRLRVGGQRRRRLVPAAGASRPRERPRLAHSPSAPTRATASSGRSPRRRRADARQLGRWPVALQAGSRRARTPGRPGRAERRPDCQRLAVHDECERRRRRARGRAGDPDALPELRRRPRGTDAPPRQRDRPAAR